MAVSESIDSALKALNETLVEAQEFVQTVADVSGDDPSPSWVYSVRRLVDRIAEANGGVQQLMIQQGLPRLRDFDGVGAKRP